MNDTLAKIGLSADKVRELMSQQKKDDAPSALIPQRKTKTTSTHKKLTAERKEQLRADIRSRQYTNADLCRMYGLTAPTVQWYREREGVMLPTLRKYQTCDNVFHQKLDRIIEMLERLIK